MFNLDKESGPDMLQITFLHICMDYNSCLRLSHVCFKDIQGDDTILNATSILVNEYTLKLH